MDQRLLDFEQRIARERQELERTIAAERLAEYRRLREAGPDHVLVPVSKLT